MAVPPTLPTPNHFQTSPLKQITNSPHTNHFCICFQDSIPTSAQA